LEGISEAPRTSERKKGMWSSEKSGKGKVVEEQWIVRGGKKRKG